MKTFKEFLIEEKGFRSSGDVIDSITEYLIKKLEKNDIDYNFESKSTNRFGGRSNYLFVSKYDLWIEIRISDHSKNTNFRTEHVWIIANDVKSGKKQVDDFIKRFSKKIKDRKSKFEKKQKEIEDNSKKIKEILNTKEGYSEFKRVFSNIRHPAHLKNKRKLEKKYDINFDRINTGTRNLLRGLSDI